MTPETQLHRLAEREAADCARTMFLELTGGRPRPENGYIWHLCERHGGEPLLDGVMPPGQIAYWDGEDIVIDARADLAEIFAALPEELAHRLSSRETPRFEPLNYELRHAFVLAREEFQELVGQQVAVLFAKFKEAGKMRNEE